MLNLAFRNVSFSPITINNTVYITSAQLAEALGYARLTIGDIFEKLKASRKSKGGYRPRQSGAFFTSTPMVGVETGYKIPARGNPDAATFGCRECARPPAFQAVLSKSKGGNHA